MSHCPDFNPFLNCYSFPGYPPRPPSLNGFSKLNCISKLAKFAHYGGACCPSENDNCCQPKAPRKRNCHEGRTHRHPPLPPCQPKCIPNCKDLPAQRLRNVDILEELCYYTPGESNGPMDCYTVDCCGNVEKVEDDNCCCCEDENDGENSGGSQPVKYSRRQRFSFNDKHPLKQTCNDPWPFNQGEDHCCGNTGNNDTRKCQPGGSHARSHCIGREEKNATGNICCDRRSICCPTGPDNPEDAFPGDSGVYYYDHKTGGFVPERELPRAPEVIQRLVAQSAEIEDYEILPDKHDPVVQCPPPKIQPIVQPIIMPEGSNCQPPCGPCAMPPPSINCCPPPCNPCNPCGPPCNPCNPCAPPFFNPCMPCAPQNPFMNMCGGSLPMVIPMCPQQDFQGMLPPFNPSWSKGNKTKKGKKKSSKSTSYYPTTYTNTGASYSYSSPSEENPTNSSSFGR